MPVEFLSDEQVAAYGRFSGELPAGDVERLFYLDDADRNLIARRRADHHRLGFTVQLGTVRAVGRSLEDPLNVPWPAVEFLTVFFEIPMCRAICLIGIRSAKCSRRISAQSSTCNIPSVLLARVQVRARLSGRGQNSGDVRGSVFTRRRHL
jgi:hypothetical protein